MSEQVDPVRLERWNFEHTGEPPAKYVSECGGWVKADEALAALSLERERLERQKFITDEVGRGARNYKARAEKAETALDEEESRTLLLRGRVSELEEDLESSESDLAREIARAEHAERAVERKENERLKAESALSLEREARNKAEWQYEERRVEQAAVEDQRDHAESDLAALQARVSEQDQMIRVAEEHTKHWEGSAAHWRELAEGSQARVQGCVEELERRIREPEEPRSMAGKFIQGYSKACKDALALLRPETSTKGGDASHEPDPVHGPHVAGAGLDDGSGPSVLPQAFTELQERATAAKLADDVTEFAWRRLANDLHALLQRDPAPSTEAGEEACTRGSDWCDGKLCRERGIECPYADPVDQPVSPEPTPCKRCGSVECGEEQDARIEILEAEDSEPTPEDPQNKSLITAHNGPEDSEAVEKLAREINPGCFESNAFGPGSLQADHEERQDARDRARKVLAAITPLLPPLESRSDESDHRADGHSGSGQPEDPGRPGHCDRGIPRRDVDAGVRDPAQPGDRAGRDASPDRLLADPLAPPLLPGLGEEDRERLRRIAEVFDSRAKAREVAGEPTAAELQRDAGAFLRDLADRPAPEDPLGELLEDEAKNETATLAAIDFRRLAEKGRHPGCTIGAYVLRAAIDRIRQTKGAQS